MNIEPLKIVALLSTLTFLVECIVRGQGPGRGRAARRTTARASGSWTGR
jgi:hypothetical protein